jgi:hypothetical protein
MTTPHPGPKVAIPGREGPRRTSTLTGPMAVAGTALPSLIESDIRYMRELLGNLIDFSGMSRREVEMRLLEAGCGTDLGRLLHGRLSLKVEHVLALCWVLELDPREFFDMAFKRRPRSRSPLLCRLDALRIDSRTIAPLPPDAPGAVPPPRGRAGRLWAIEQASAELAHAVARFGRLALLLLLDRDGTLGPEEHSASGAPPEESHDG